MPEQLLERSNHSTKSEAAQTPPDRKPQVEAHRFVDMWLVPGIHPTNADLVQKLKSAEDRQFGANMDVCGIISDRDPKAKDWEKTHLVGIRSDVWKPSERDRRRALNSLKKTRKQQIRREIKKSGRLSEDQKVLLDSVVEDDDTMNLDAGDVDKRRLVLKLFRSTGKNIRWAGTMEEIASREIQNSLGSKRPLLSFAVNLSRYDYITYINQNHRTLRVPAVFTFSYYDEAASRMWYIEVKRKHFSLGIDFTVESGGRRIGLIDGKLISLGRDSHVYIYEPSLAADGRFMDILTLFAASIGCHRAMRRHVKRRLKALRAGQLPHMIDGEEFKLLENPRRQ